MRIIKSTNKNNKIIHRLKNKIKQREKRKKKLKTVFNLNK